MAAAVWRGGKRLGPSGSRAGHSDSRVFDLELTAPDRNGALDGIDNLRYFNIPSALGGHQDGLRTHHLAVGSGALLGTLQQSFLLIGTQNDFE